MMRCENLYTEIHIEIHKQKLKSYLATVRAEAAIHTLIRRVGRMWCLGKSEKKSVGEISQVNAQEIQR